MYSINIKTKETLIDTSPSLYGLFFEDINRAVDEGLCVQIMHHGPFDDEPATVALMDEYLEANRYVNDITDKRLHHEIYLSDARKIAPEKWKTVIRHPIRRL